jgi:hypothetical protein
VCARGSNRTRARGPSTSPLDVMFVRASIPFVASVAVALAALVGVAQVPTTQHGPSADTFMASHYGGGDGLTKKNAVVLKIASDVGGIASEYAWVHHTYPGSEVLEQALTAWENGKRYDILTVKTAGGHCITLWFDITAMYK